jgi:hypothetical protein
MDEDLQDDKLSMMESGEQSQTPREESGFLNNKSLQFSNVSTFTPINP